MKKATKTDSRLLNSTILPGVLRFLICLCGMLFFTWAFTDSRFRDAEGFLQGAFCLPISVGAALLILGWNVTGRLKRPALWFALALVGQAVALQMLDAGPRVAYQHYKPFDALIRGYHPLLLIYITVQAMLVVSGLRNRWRIIKIWLSRNFKIWQLFSIGLIVFLYSATMSSNISFYVAELIFAAFVQIVNLGNIVLVAWALPDEAIVFLKQKLNKIFVQSITEETGKTKKLDRFALCAAIWVTGLAGILCVLSYEKHPHIPDEISYIYHARYFAEGMINMPAPPVQEAFDLDFMFYEDQRWYSLFPPGWPLMLTLGFLFGVPWLVNPVLAGLNILLISILVQEIFDRDTSRMTILLLCASPWYVFMGTNFMAHTFTLSCALTASVAVALAKRKEKSIWGWIGGISIGMVSLIRPLEGLVVGGLLGIWALGFGGRRLKSSALAGLVMGAVFLGSLGLFYNNLLTGSPLKFPLMVYFDKHIGPGSNALGFGPERGFGWHKNWRFLDPYPGHSPLESFLNANLNIFAVNKELFGWSTGSLVLIAILLFSGKITRNDLTMLTVVGAIIGVHSFYWFSGGPDFGARYWFLIIVPCVVLTARGIHYLSSRLNSDSADDNIRGVHAVIGVVLLCLMAFLNYIPWRAVDKYHHYRGFRPDIRKLAEESNFGKSLILIRGNNYNDFPSAAIYNPVDLQEDKPIYAWDKSSEVRTKLLKAYSDRNVWIVNGPSMTSKGFKIVNGPLPATQLLSEELRKKNKCKK